MIKFQSAVPLEFQTLLDQLGLAMYFKQQLPHHRSHDDCIKLEHRSKTVIDGLISRGEKKIEAIYLTDDGPMCVDYWVLNKTTTRINI